MKINLLAIAAINQTSREGEVSKLIRCVQTRPARLVYDMLKEDGGKGDGLKAVEVKVFVIGGEIPPELLSRDSYPLIISIPLVEASLVSKVLAYEVAAKDIVITKVQVPK